MRTDGLIRGVAGGILWRLRRAVKHAHEGRPGQAIGWLTSAYFELGNWGESLRELRIGDKDAFDRLSVRCAKVETVVRSAIWSLEDAVSVPAPSSWLPMADVAGGRP